MPQFCLFSALEGTPDIVKIFEGFCPFSTPITDRVSGKKMRECAKIPKGVQGCSINQFGKPPSLAPQPFKQAWLRLALSRLGIAQASLALLLLLQSLMALGLASVEVSL